MQIILSSFHDLRIWEDAKGKMYIAKGSVVTRKGNVHSSEGPVV